MFTADVKESYFLKMGNFFKQYIISNTYQFAIFNFETIATAAHQETSNLWNTLTSIKIYSLPFTEYFHLVCIISFFSYFNNKLNQIVFVLLQDTFSGDPFIFSHMFL